MSDFLSYKQLCKVIAVHSDTKGEGGSGKGRLYVEM